uniref:Phosphofructokinase domain-containing protein n=1 Tax=Picea sitchensis TaxID=3332 RepID=B8LPI7_PICSI|nr:unknown [Picea sitchensis]
MQKLERELSTAGAVINYHGQKRIQGTPHLREYLQDVPTFTNPLMHNQYFLPIEGFFVTEHDMVMENIVVDIQTVSRETQVLYHRAGPRSEVCFSPDEVHAAIVTCGRLSPGVNTVVRELVIGLWFRCGVRDIKGIKSGYRGFYSSEPVVLYPKLVDNWHKIGGSTLETSRGGFDLQKIVDGIEAHGFNQVYIIGGDGTMKGAVKVFEEVKRRRLKVSIAGIPNSVDNDVGIIDASFGFHTAVETAQSAIHGAMAGYTGFAAGLINGIYSYIPLDLVAATQNFVDVNDHKWAWMRSVTNQPDFSGLAKSGKI